MGQRRVLRNQSSRRRDSAPASRPCQGKDLQRRTRLIDRRDSSCWFDFEGFEVGKGSQQHPGALLLGAYRNGKLHYFGHSELEVQRKRNRRWAASPALVIDKSPFVNPPKIKERSRWLSQGSRTRSPMRWTDVKILYVMFCSTGATILAIQT